MTNRRETARKPRERGGWLLAAAALAALSACSDPEGEAAGAEAAEDSVAVEVSTVEQREISRTVETSATLAGSRSLTVTPEVGGIAEKIYVDQGDEVEAGDPLVRIASVDYSLAVDSAQSQKQAARAGLDQAKARMETARKQYERFQELYEDDVVAKAKFEEVKTAYEQAKAGYEAAKAQAERASTGVKQAQTRVDDTVVRAPFAGHVVRRMLDEGSVIRPMASPVLHIVDDEPIRAEGSVGELNVPEIEEGMEATVRVDALPEESFQGAIKMVNRQIDPRTREAAIRVELPNEEGQLRAGMSGTITIELGAREHPVVPRRALFDRQGSTAAVFVVESERAERRSVEVDAGFEGRVPVLEGLSVGDRVVVWGRERLQDGDTVRIKSSGEETGDDESDAKTPDSEGEQP